MALNLSPNEIKVEKSICTVKTPRIIKKKKCNQEDATCHISYLDNISPKASSVSSPSESTSSSSRPNYGLLTAFHSELVELPDVIRAKSKIDPDYKNYTCGICEKSLLTKQELKVHVIECHAIQKNYKCEICNKRFRLKNSLNLHGNTHTGAKPYKCSSCDKHFTQKSSLNTHVKQFHDSNVKLLECYYCSKTFKLKYFLDVHYLTHNGLKPYKCNLCDSKFTQKSSLNTHVKQFHESSVPMFQCMRCDKKFLRESMLDKHIENHP